MKKVLTILLIFITCVVVAQVPRSFKNNKIITDTLILKKLKISTSDTMLIISGDSVRYRIYSSGSSGISGDSLFFYNGTWYNKFDTLFIKITSIDSLIKINGTWYNRYDSITLTASADSAIFATKSYVMNNYKGRADSVASSGFLTRHQAALSYAPISVQNYFSKTGKNIYPTTSDNRLMLGSSTMSDTLASTLLNVVNGSVCFKGTTGATPTSGAGTRLMWIPAKYAFRIGKVTGTKWDAANVGDGSFALNDATASGSNAIALMDNASATYNYSMAVGWYAVVGQSNAFAFGNGVTTNGQYGFSCGNGTTQSTYQGFGCGAYNVIQGTATVSYSYDQIFFIGNGIGAGSNLNSAVVVRRNGQMGINIGDTSAFPRARFQINVKSNKYTDRNIFHFVDNVRNQKINTLTQVRDTSCYYGVFTTTGKFQLFNVDNTGTLTALLDSTGEFTSKITHAFLNTPDTTYTPAVAQNVYTTLVFPKIDELVNFTKTGDSLIVGKSGSYYFTFNWTMQGANGEDYKMAVFYNGTLIATATQTTTGSTNFQGQSMQGYIDNAAVGDRITLRITNLTNNNDPTLRQGSFYIRREY